MRHRLHHPLLFIWRCCSQPWVKYGSIFCVVSAKVFLSQRVKLPLTLTAALDIFRDLICQEPLAAYERTDCTPQGSNESSERPPVSSRLFQCSAFSA